MKINFTKKEYQTLVEMLLVADWVITGHEEEERETTKPYKELRKKVLSHHKEMGMADAFEYSPEHDEYFETAAYEANGPHMRFIDEYDEQVFWEELATRLAHRDIAAEETLSVKEPLGETELTKKLVELIARYEEEFAENGLDNIRFVPDALRVH
jgi:hypothetical protein